MHKIKRKKKINSYAIDSAVLHSHNKSELSLLLTSKKVKNACSSFVTFALSHRYEG